MARTDPHFRLRIPAELLQRLAADATANKRSTTAEIVARLEASGETLRDRFAMAALGAIISAVASGKVASTTGTTGPAEFAAAAYANADAMLAERQKGGA